MTANKRLARRRFLAGVTASAAAAAVPLVLPSRALGRDGAVPPSERIGLAYLGPGGRGSGLVSEFTRRDDVESLAVCDPQVERREKAQRLVEQVTAERKPGGNYRACRAYVDFREVLARPDIDGVVVAACEHWRPVMCIMAAKAGKDIYTEKPFSLTIGEGRALAEAVRRHGRILQHGTQRRSSNEQGLRDTCEIARNGRLGRLTHATVWVGPAPRPDSVDFGVWPDPPPRNVVDWDLWLGPGPLRPFSKDVLGWNWHITRGYGLGSIGNWGSHTLDMAQWALGKDDDSPVEIIPPSSQSPLTLKYADGLAIHVPRTRGDCSDVAVFGTEGQKTILGRPPIDDKYDPTPLGPGEIRLYNAEGDHGGNWLHCMRTRGRTICNEDIALRSSTLCHLIHAADRLNRPLRFDPVRLEFPGDDEANRLVAAPLREPWQIF